MDFSSIDSTTKFYTSENFAWARDRFHVYDRYCNWIQQNKNDGIETEYKIIDQISEWLGNLTQTQLDRLSTALHANGVIFNHSKPTRHRIADIIMGVLMADVKLRRIIVTLKDVQDNMVPKFVDAIIKIIIMPYKATFTADAREAIQANLIRIMTPQEFLQYLSKLAFGPITSTMMAYYRIINHKITCPSYGQYIHNKIIGLATPRVGEPEPKMAGLPRRLINYFIVKIIILFDSEATQEKLPITWEKLAHRRSKAHLGQLPRLISRADSNSHEQGEVTSTPFHSTPDGNYSATVRGRQAYERRRASVIQRSLPLVNNYNLL